MQTVRSLNPTFVPLPVTRAYTATLDLAVESAAGDARIVRVKTAKLTYPVLASFFDAVRAIVQDGASKLVLDLEAVSYIDSETIPGGLHGRGPGLGVSRPAGRGCA